MKSVTFCVLASLREIFKPQSKRNNTEFFEEKMASGEKHKKCQIWLRFALPAYNCF
jgi:hypothetical protein